MNISNVELDRDKETVSFDAGDEKGYVRTVRWNKERGGWRLAQSTSRKYNVAEYLLGIPYSGPPTSSLYIEPLKETTPDQEPTPDYYNKTYKGIKLDSYRICQIVGISGGPREHAFKKLMRGTNKGDIETDLELIESLEGILARWKEMIKEDAE